MNTPPDAPHILQLVRAAERDEPLAVPPHSIEAEQSLLGALLLDNHAFKRVADLVGADDFYRDDHRRIWRHIASLIEKSKPADIVTVWASIDASEDKDRTAGAAYLGALAQNTPSVINVRRYAELVRERSVQRRLAQAGNEIAQSAVRGDVGKLRSLVDQLDSVAGAASAVENDWPPELDLKALAQREPERPRFIMDGLPCGYATGVFGHGGVGKSAIELHRAICIAAGIQFFGLQTERRCVFYLSCEDREGILHWRLARICAYLGVDLATLDGWLKIVDLVGRDAILWDRDPRTGYTVTPAFERLPKRIKAHGTEVLFVDGISDTFGGNENARTDVKRFINALLWLIPADRGAVVLIGHIDKATAKAIETTQGYSGSTAWHNTVRARWYLYPETEQGDDNARPERTGALILELQKSNLGRMDLVMRFAWDEDAHLFVGRLEGGPTRFDAQHRDRTEQDGIRRALKACADQDAYVPSAMTGPRTAYHVLSERPEFPDSLKGGGRAKSKRFWKHIEALRLLKHVEESSYRRKDNRKAIPTFLLTLEGSAACAECA